ncbi:MAG: hypothetical protein RLY66_300 [Candidatus Parcubacteria bacterium]|jgi:hypothetical protein
MLPTRVVEFISDQILEMHKGDNRNLLLTCLRDDPQEVYKWIRGNLHDWTTLAACHLREVVVVNDSSQNSLEIVEHLKKVLADELQALPIPAQK